eukprot:8010059-Alexandrium_andersonii.AAC.1
MTTRPQTHVAGSPENSLGDNASLLSAMARERLATPTPRKRDLKPAQEKPLLPKAFASPDTERPRSQRNGRARADLPLARTRPPTTTKGH